jgi:transcription-repair coupling factor (superfamily II helicase)
MDLSPLLELFRELPEYDRLEARFETARQPLFAPTPRAARLPLVTSTIHLDRPPRIYLVSRNDRLLTLAEEIHLWFPGLDLGVFAEPTPLPYEQVPWGPRTRLQRAAVLGRLVAADLPGVPRDQNPPPAFILATARAVMTRTLSPRTLLANSRWLGVGRKRRLDQLLTGLHSTGYAHQSVVSEPGHFSHRGGILDVWVPSDERPVRIEFFGDEIETMRSFDVSSQRSLEPVSGFFLPPAREGLPKLYRPQWGDQLPAEAAAGDLAEPQVPFLEMFLARMESVPFSLLDYLPVGTKVFLEDLASFESAVDESEEQALELKARLEERQAVPDDLPLPYLTSPELRERLRELAAIDLGVGNSAAIEPIDFTSRISPGPRFGGQIRPLFSFLASRAAAHESAFIVSRQAARLAELWSQEASPTQARQRAPADFAPGETHFLQGALSDGWIMDHPQRGRIHVLTDAEIFGWSRPQPRRQRIARKEAPEASYVDLSPGDLVVHVDFGVGQFAGLVERTLSDLRREYLLIEYGGGGQVYVPVHQADRITRYVGVDGAVPQLSNLGTTDWDRVRERARVSAEEVARDLLDLYATRMTVEGHQYSEDTEWQGELEASFPYEETQDQLEAIASVKRDMESQRPMDRLICGDVGYGKTEVALRAAFKAVMDNRQVAVLVPTTILAQQHYNTFLHRLAAYPVTIEMLSRFRSRAEAAAIIERLKSGDIDIVIGTHRLLQPDVGFRKLGLLVIDEEQRFGVTHKEFLKQMRTQVDVLTMTATPIPRTLYMALTGVRDISTIDTPPEERVPVVTHVGHYDPALVRQAILRERDRGGQVFFVHNRVQTISRMADRLQRLLPEVDISVAHGQMPEAELARVMSDFVRGEIEVLISTSIIESGLDIPNANTLIVDGAERFGLAQLYQLRGRVGRGPTRGYAYFFRRPHQRATEDALKRLEVIAEHSQLGAGYSIALRDLEIRGAGDILGTRQHGQIAAIGFHLYTRLLASAVQRLRRVHEGPLPTETAESLAQDLLETAVDLPLASALPPDYVQNRELRLQLYRRMANLRHMDDIRSLREELSDRFGEPPPEVDNLLYQLQVKVLAWRANVRAITSEQRQILLQLDTVELLESATDLGQDVRLSKRGLWITRQNEHDWQERLMEVLLQLGAVREAR